METSGCFTHLQLPDAAALHFDPLHGAVHEGDEHVEQQDVGEDDVADEENVEDLPVVVVLRELHVAHADGELEELQRGVGDVGEAGFHALLISSEGSKETPLTHCFVFHRRLFEQGDHGWDRRQEEGDV